MDGTPIYVVGHVNPDTDSIASAMGYAWLLRERDNINTVAGRAGPINPQTSWVLKQLNLDSPVLLTDASPRFESVMRRYDTTRPARILYENDGSVHLFTGIDVSKDQSYVLSMLDQRQLQKTILPLGSMTKTEVRAYAARVKLPVAEKPESQDLCFLGDENYYDFLHKYRSESLKPGPILTLTGKEIGRHKGLAAYTVGQRKGIGVADNSPYYVVDKDPEQNALIVGKSTDLQYKRFIAYNFNWINGTPNLKEFPADVMVRYRASRAPALIRVVDERKALIQLSEPRRDIAQGQIAVVYKGDEVLGGGIIQNEVNK